MTESFVCHGVRTPIGRYGGALSHVRPDDLAAHVLRCLLARAPSIEPSQIDDVLLGCVNQAGEDNRNVARMAALLAGYPVSVPGSTVNRLCGSGLDAIASAARAIRCGEAHLIAAGGVESMSRAPYVLSKSTRAFSREAELHDSTLGWRFINPQLHELFGTDSMPETAENVAEACSISRSDQDAFAFRSQARAERAWASGSIQAEIVPVPGPSNNSPSVDRDELPRKDTTVAKLAALPTPFRSGGAITAGNSSGLGDGACALFIASAEGARKQGLIPRARIVGSAVAGVAPRLMGLGPIPAVEKLLALTGVALSSIEVVEINEAFAAQMLAVLRALGLPDDAEHVNADGGTIALGHPLGMTGARLVLTATSRLQRTHGRYALVAMCIGVGQGIALLLERAT